MAVQPLSPATDRRLGEPLPHQPANQTRAHLSAIKSLIIKSCGSIILCGIISRFQLLSPSVRQVAHVLLTRPPLCNEICPKTSIIAPFDLHVLGTPPAFILSQDRTLMLNVKDFHPLSSFLTNRTKLSFLLVRYLLNILSRNVFCPQNPFGCPPESLGSFIASENLN